MLQAQRSRRQQARAEPGRPALRVRLDGDVERRFLADGGGDGPGGRLAVGLAPAVGQPARHVPVERVAFAQDRLARPRDVAQDGVDQGCKGRTLAVEANRAHREVDRRVVRDVEEQDLRGGDDQRPFDLGRLARQALLQPVGDSRPHGAEAPQGRGDDGARQGAVARVEVAEAVGDGGG